eukprot:jgi/Mesen1/9150/ME000587S08648
MAIEQELEAIRQKEAMHREKMQKAYAKVNSLRAQVASMQQDHNIGKLKDLLMVQCTVSCRMVEFSSFFSMQGC